MKRGYGEILKNAREKKGLKHSDAQKQLKITEVYLKAMEDEDEDVFEKPVYIRMFLKTYAKFLKVDDREIIELYESDPEGAAREKAAKKVQDDIAAGIRAEIADEPHEAENKAAAEKREKTAKVEKLEFSIKNKYRIIGAGLFLIIAAVVVIIM
ncbi:MAG TPA: hypothetical protein ENN55_04020, partial [Firmicutes bacterium]|nr:hypothetical protein [Bacillota bacterium]